MAHPTRHSLHSRSHSRSRVHARSYDARGRLSNVTQGSDDLSPTTRYAHTVGVFGCTGLACLTSTPQDQQPQMSMELTLGGGIEICDPQKSTPPP
jgi:hypothetical protein